MIDAMREESGADYWFESDLTHQCELQIEESNIRMVELQMAHAMASLILILILGGILSLHIGMAAEDTAQQSRAVFGRAALQAVDVAAKDLVCALPEEQDQCGYEEKFFQIWFH